MNETIEFIGLSFLAAVIGWILAGYVLTPVQYHSDTVQCRFDTEKTSFVWHNDCNNIIKNSDTHNEVSHNNGTYMEKFFAVLVIVVFTGVIIGIKDISKTSKADTVQAMEVLVKTNNSRSPF